MTKKELEAIRARYEAENHISQALAVAKSLKWILNNIEDCGPNTFEHAIYKYVGEAICLLEKWHDIPEILNALDELEAERDQWKERFKHEVRGLCDYCINRNDEPYCKRFQNNKCDWQFDEARFAECGESV